MTIDNHDSYFSYHLPGYQQCIVSILIKDLMLHTNDYTEQQPLLSEIKTNIACGCSDQSMLLTNDLILMSMLI